jgi:competence ComEA-like helix-hairpin-helix protein
LILLVWNASVTARDAVRVVHPPSPGAAPVFFGPSHAFDVETALRSAGSPRRGTLTVCQAYLLGKRVDINKASVDEISSLPGISGTTAAAVVEERDRIGRFRSAADLLGVKGIKGKRLQKILPFLAGMSNN